MHATSVRHHIIGGRDGSSGTDFWQRWSPSISSCRLDDNTLIVLEIHRGAVDFDQAGTDIGPVDCPASCSLLLYTICTEHKQYSRSRPLFLIASSRGVSSYRYLHVDTGKRDTTPTITNYSERWDRCSNSGLGHNTIVIGKFSKRTGGCGQVAFCPHQAQPRTQLQYYEFSGSMHSALYTLTKHVPRITSCSRGWARTSNPTLDPPTPPRFWDFPSTEGRVPCIRHGHISLLDPIVNKRGSFKSEKKVAPYISQTELFPQSENVFTREWTEFLWEKHFANTASWADQETATYNCSRAERDSVFGIRAEKF